jgi:hypothetical protein
MLHDPMLVHDVLFTGLMAGAVLLVPPPAVVALRHPGLASAALDWRSRDRRVPTPGGWRLASQGHLIPRGHGLSLWAGHVLELDADGSVVRDLGADLPLIGIGSRVGLSRERNNWVAWAYWTRPAGHAITADTTTWVVPPPPATYHGQTTYLFNGIEDTATYILQAVLQYGPVAGYGGGRYWRVACYLVGGRVWAFSGAVRVEPGDVITGIVDSARQAPQSAYSCAVHVNGRPQVHLDLVNHAHDQWPEFYVAVEALEAARISRCTDYPDVDVTAMSSISIGTHGGHPNPVGWFTIDQTTDCHQHAVLVSYSNPGGEVDLYYRNPGRPSPR